MKNGAPIQMLTRITETRAHIASPVHGIGSTPSATMIQLKAE